MWPFNRYLGQRIPPDASAIGAGTDTGKKVGIVHPERLYRAVGQTIVERGPGFSAVGRMKYPAALSAGKEVGAGGEEEGLNVGIGKAGIGSSPGIAGVFGKKHTFPRTRKNLRAI